MSFLSLPKCIIQYIAENWLSPIDILNLRKVCKKTNGIVKKVKCSGYDYIKNIIKNIKMGDNKTLYDFINEIDGCIAGSFVLSKVLKWNCVDNVFVHNDIDIFLNSKYEKLILDHIICLHDKSKYRNRKFKNDNDIVKVLEGRLQVSDIKCDFVFIDNDINPLKYIMKKSDLDICKCFFTKNNLHIENLMNCVNKKAVYYVEKYYFFNYHDNGNDCDYSDNNDNGNMDKNIRKLYEEYDNHEKNKFIRYIKNIKNIDKEIESNFRFKDPFKFYKNYDPLNFYKRYKKYTNRGYQIILDPNIKIYVDGVNIY